MRLTSFFLALVLLGSPLAHARQITIAASDYAPYNFEENGRIKGMSAEVVKAALKMAGLKATLTLYPWPRAYRMALNTPKTLVFPISRLAEREDLFNWVGTISPANSYLYGLAKRTDIKLETLDDAKKFNIGCVREDFALKYLLRKGFKIRTVNHLEELNIKMLLKGRVDLIPFTETAFSRRIEVMGLQPARFRKYFHLCDISADFYMAFSKDTPGGLVDKMRRALAALKKSGRYDRIINSYLPQGCSQ